MQCREAFRRFVRSCLVTEKAARYVELSATKRGRDRFLAGLFHEFESTVRPDAVRGSDYGPIRERPCFVFYEPLGFGVEFPTVREACDRLSSEDGWLIVLRDGSAGIHRPEARWDHEMLIVA